MLNSSTAKVQEIALLIKKACLVTEMSQAKLADYLGITHGYMSKIANGKKTPSKKIVSELERLIGEEKPYDDVTYMFDNQSRKMLEIIADKHGLSMSKAFEKVVREHLLELLEGEGRTKS